MGGSIDAKAFERFIIEVDLETGSSAGVNVGDQGGGGGLGLCVLEL